MKIEIGESLVYSYLRHERNCLITQTNWKPSGNWVIPDDIYDQAIYEFDKINRHHAFSDIFKSELSQTIKQAEIDVLGVNQKSQIFAFEVAFHENGLQYGGKIETRNRIFKKLLRNYITLKCYFPNKEYTIAFCSPKVNPATEKHIQDYFEVLLNDFKSDGVIFSYYSNEKFQSRIVEKVLVKTTSESDSGELFARSVKLLNVTDKYKTDDKQNSDLLNSNEDKSLSLLKPPLSTGPIDTEGENLIEYVIVGKISIPTSKEDTETVQDYVKKIMRLLLNNDALSNDEIERLQNKYYCKKTFELQFPLLRNINKGYKDKTGRGRYWSKEIFGEKYYVCSQWWKDRHPVSLMRIKQWIISMQDK